MKRLKELDKEESQLNLAKERLANEEKQVSRIKETYDQHFYEARYFFDRLCSQFYKNDHGTFYQSLLDEHSQKANQILRQLETDEAEIHKQKKKVFDQLEDVHYEKRRLLAEEKSHEY
jgi:monomeric isocitrate dehydrogenase